MGKGETVKEIGAQELALLLASGEKLDLIDVRTPAETSRGILPAAENIPLHLLPLRADEIGRRRRLVFYCRSGARSAQACLFMQTQGHWDVYNLQGGINAWTGQGLPLRATGGSLRPGVADPDHALGVGI
jgi:rhodanese-related sulfurtransferase